MSVLYDIGKTHFFLKPLFTLFQLLFSSSYQGNTTVLNALVNLTYTSKISKRYILRYKARVRDGEGGHFCFVNNMLLSIFCFEEIVFLSTWYDKIKHDCSSFVYVSRISMRATRRR